MSVAGLVLALTLIPLALLLAKRRQRSRAIRKLEARASLAALSMMPAHPVPDLRLVTDETPLPPPRSFTKPAWTFTRRMNLLAYGSGASALVAIAFVGLTAPNAAGSSDPAAAGVSSPVPASDSRPQVTSSLLSTAPSRGASTTAGRTAAPGPSTAVKPTAAPEKTVVVTTTVPAAPAPAPQPHPLPAQPAPVQPAPVVQAAPVPAAPSIATPPQDPAQGQKKDASKSVLGAVGSAVSGLIAPLIGQL
jgi:hypothetical protein